MALDEADLIRIRSQLDAALDALLETRLVVDPTPREWDAPRMALAAELVANPEQRRRRTMVDAILRDLREHVPSTLTDDVWLLDAAIREAVAHAAEVGWSCGVDTLNPRKSVTSVNASWD